MAVLQCFLFCLAAAPLVEGWVLKIGGPVQSTSTGAKGRAAFDLFKAWSESAANTHGFTVETHWVEYDAASAAQVATDLTVNCNPACVDVLICPYGSGPSATTIGGASATVPILVWGGAANSIFHSTCTGKRCFGTLTVASEYFVAGFDGLATMVEDGHHKSVGLLANDNSFSQSLAQGVVDYSASHSKFPVVAQTTVPKGALDEAGMAKVKEVLMAMPEVVVIAGHSGGDVEDIVMMIASHTQYRPEVIMATNSITAAAKTQFDMKGMAGAMEGLIMPQQWGRTPGMKDNIVGWTSDDFANALGEDMTSYHSASAGGAAVALANAAAGLSSAAGLADALHALDIQTFYGHVSFTDHGNLAAKPMYAEQMGGTHSKIVMPISSATGYLRYPLSAVGMWASTKTMKCGDVKMAYKKQMCCGQPEHQMMMH